MTSWALLVHAVLLFLCALAVRLPWLAGDAVPLGGDEVTYHALAARLLEGTGFVSESGTPTAWRTPGLPGVLSIIYWLAEPDPAIARVVLVVITSLTAPALYGFSFLLFRSKPIALLSGLSWAALPTSHRLA